MPGAARELESIYEPLYSHILRQLYTLRRFPKLGSQMERPHHRWRVLIVEIFFIVYREVPRGVEVVQVRHAKREPISAKDLPG